MSLPLKPYSPPRWETPFQCTSDLEAVACREERDDLIRHERQSLIWTSEGYSGLRLCQARDFEIHNHVYGRHCMPYMAIFLLAVQNTGGDGREDDAAN